MTLPESLLPKLSEWHPAGDGRHSLSVTAPEAGWTVHLTADKADTLSCLVWELTLSRTVDAPRRVDAPKAWAEGVAGGVTGLLEPLKLLEVDDGCGEALLRSESPAKKGERVAYYEVRLFGLNRAVPCSGFPGVSRTASRGAAGAGRPCAADARSAGEAGRRHRWIRFLIVVQASRQQKR